MNPSELSQLAVFQHLLPSVARTVECGFDYLVVLGYDVGDRFWDETADAVARAELWFEQQVARPLREVGVTAHLKFARVKNDVKKPGPVFTAITQTAFDAGADYIYRVNDDTELVTRWAGQFVAALAALDNVGAVGPTCRQGNRKILTHDFTHRTHMDIFQGQYYPPELSDWWMDDWISRVYGLDRTLRQTSGVARTRFFFVRGAFFSLASGGVCFVLGSSLFCGVRVRVWKATRFYQARTTWRSSTTLARTASATSSTRRTPDCSTTSSSATAARSTPTSRNTTHEDSMTPNSQEASSASKANAADKATNSI